MNDPILWCIYDTFEEKVAWTHGGSSTKPKLMVYDSEPKARAGRSRQRHMLSESPARFIVAKLRVDLFYNREDGPELPCRAEIDRQWAEQ